VRNVVEVGGWGIEGEEIYGSKLDVMPSQMRSEMVQGRGRERWKWVMITIKGRDVHQDCPLQLGRFERDCPYV
jgi:hypothetical protein